jgi:uncharacterized repeat protein (TIGR01451 family)
MHRSLPTTLLITSSFLATAQFGPQHFAFVSDVEYPWRIQFADLNGDGHADAISQENYDLYWWSNDGNGVFGERQFLFHQMLSSTDQMVATDVDMDNDVDLVCRFGWWANDGVGNFTFANNINPYLQLAMVGDVDGDGDPDLVGQTGVLNGNILTTFFGTVINDGNGNFTDGVSLGSNPANTINATQADFDDDGDMDLVLGGDAALNGYYPNVGLGFYGARQVITNLNGTATVQASDVEGDGDQDLFVYGGTPSNRWFANDGNAVFTVADTMGGSAPTVDVDNDGDQDMCLGTGTSCDAKWYRNDGAGLAWSSLNVELFSGYNLVGTRYAFADINEDGSQDMAICHGLGMIAWYPNNGDGTFALRERIGDVLSSGSGISSADLDDDGDNDLVCAGFYADMVTAYYNNGDGTFGDQVVLVEHLDQVSTTATADLDGDGYPEILTNKAAAAVLWNNGDGTFTTGSLPNNGTSTLAADLDGDLDLDLVASGKWYRNEGGGSFTEVAEPLFAINGSAPAHFADLNGDQIIDVLCRGTTLEALINDGNGSFTQVTSTLGSGINKGDVADIDADGDIDLFGMVGTAIWGYYNDGNGAFTAAQLTAPDVGVPNFLVAFDATGDGYPDAVWSRSNGYDHKTYININNGDGTLSARYLVDPSAEYTTSLLFVDVNGDVVPDLVESRFHTIAWQENHFFDAFRLRGDVFKDYDQDGIRDPTDDAQLFAPMRTDPAAMLNWTNSFGEFDMAVDSGVTYELWPQLQSIYHVTTVPDTAIVQANVNEPIVDSLLFGLGPVIDEDAEALTMSRTLLRCNTEGSFYVDVRNVGSTILTGIDVSVDLDEDFGVLNTWPTADSVVANTIYWSFDSLPWFGIQHFQVDVLAGPVGSGGMAHTTVAFASTGAVLTDSAGLQTISCAYDPNDKFVLPEGVGAHHAVPIAQDWLDYQIRFQNTGTDTAFNVLLIDRLSSDLDWSSMEVLGTSHPLTNIFIEEDGELDFRYAHINLPDSGADMAGSNGYVRFRMRPLPDRPNLTEIHNTGEIYFDYNAPVITNTTLTTLVDCEAFSSSVTQLDVDLLQASEGTSYQWYQDGSPMVGATSQELVVEVTGFYSVEVTNEYGCVLLSEELQVVISGVENMSALHVAVVPNPMSDEARVIFSEALPSATHLELVDVHGRVVRTLNGNGSREIRIERRDLESGMYVLRVMHDGEHLGSVRLVIH